MHRRELLVKSSSWRMILNPQSSASPPKHAIELHNTAHAITNVAQQYKSQQLKNAKTLL
jgi:hypothetical protein